MSTTSEHHAKVSEVFLTARRRPLDERSTFVSTACNGNQELADEVLRLLNVDQSASAFLETPLLGEGFAAAASAGPGRRETMLAVGQLVGKFRIARFIGAGGMGEVYEATQDQPRRTVALKVMHHAHASRTALRRFELESHLLARLNHPGIAPIFESGTQYDGAGRNPFFVMEYIASAQTITEFAVAKALSTRDRVELFLRVCDAVQHGHMKGVIHRDLKPANILVGESAKPKIIDFGIARAIDSDPSATTLQTDVGQLIGTLQYMAPEQCAEAALDLDTRADVYALGVILYELLCSALPYDVSGLTLFAAARIVCDTPPVRPSEYAPCLRGDLDAIILKSLEKDRDLRYGTVSELADDLGHYLNHRPISARSTSVWYRARKFARRRRAVVVAVSAAVVALAFASIGVTYALWREMAARSAEAGARNVAVEERNRAQAVVEYLSKYMRSQDPGAGDRLIRSIADAMAQAADGLQHGDLQDLPSERANLLRILAWALAHDDRHIEATSAAECALAIERGQHTGDHPLVAASLVTLADVRAAAGDATNAERLYKLALTMLNGIYPSDHPDVVKCLGALADFLRNQGRQAEALPLLQRALAMQKRLHPGDDEAVAGSMSGLAYVLESLGREEEALALYEDALRIRERLFSGDRLGTASVLNSLAWAHALLQHDLEAETFEIRALEMNRRLHGIESSEAAWNLMQLGGIRRQLGRVADSEAPFRDALGIYRRLCKGDDKDVADAMNSLARIREDLGRFAEAEPMYAEALQMWQRLYPNGHRENANTLANLARCLGAMGRLQDALPLARQAAEMAARLLPAGDDVRRKCDDVLSSLRQRSLLETNTG